MATKTIDRAAAIKKMGQMMLESWKMMAVSCPLCHTCLMQKQEAGKELQIFCPGCDLPIKVQGAAQSTSGDISSPATSASASGGAGGGGGSDDGDSSARLVLSNNTKINSDTSSSNSANLSSNSSEKPSFVREPSLEEAKKEYDRKNKQKDLISSKMGSYMMRGWAMMDRTCRNSCHATAIVGQDKDKSEGAKSEPCTLCVNTPLMRSNDKSVFLCVCCGEESAVATYDDIVAAPVLPPSPSQQSPAASSAMSKTPNMPLSAKASISEDSSSLLAKSKALINAPNSANYNDFNADDNDDGGDDDMEMMEGYNAYDPDLDFDGGNNDGWVQKSSSLISLGLLEGWHMLSEICPNGGCNVPLVSCTNSSGVLIKACVICDNMDAQKLKAKGKVVVSKTKDSGNTGSKVNGDNRHEKEEENEDDISSDDSTSSSSTSSAASSSSSSSKASTSSSTSSSSFSSTTTSEETGVKRRPLVTANKSSHSISAATSAANKSRNYYGSFDARTGADKSNRVHAATATNTASNANATSTPLLSKTLNALNGKLRQCTDRLGDPTISTKEALQLAKLIKNLADAIKSSRHMLD